MKGYNLTSVTVLFFFLTILLYIVDKSCGNLLYFCFSYWVHPLKRQPSSSMLCPLSEIFLSLWKLLSRDETDQSTHCKEHFSACSERSDSHGRPRRGHFRCKWQPPLVLKADIRKPDDFKRMQSNAWGRVMSTWNQSSCLPLLSKTNAQRKGPVLTGPWGSPDIMCLWPVASLQSSRSPSILMTQIDHTLTKLIWSEYFPEEKKIPCISEIIKKKADTQNKRAALPRPNVHEGRCSFNRLQGGSRKEDARCMWGGDARGWAEG